ncbi:MAG TPA: T9SS type A sorting domain-containing protein, partial [Draconibacterium sp.]|nr:T9SS type A sorting domain-containing protein [Draconibacterium sp.]
TEETESSETNVTAIKNTEANNSKHFSFYPNPVSQYLNIQLDSAQPGDFYTIYNINGEKVVSNQIGSLLTTVNFGSYSPGIYLLRVVSGDSVFNERIIKK